MSNNTNRIWNTNLSNNSIQLFASLMLLISGASSLAYQISWLRLLKLSIGSTSVALALVLAAFFCGLALGSYLESRVNRKNLNNLLPYVYIEAGIGISALLLLPVILNLDYFVTQFSVLGNFTVFKFSIAFIVLCIPTTLIGATYPLLSSILIRDQESLYMGLGHFYAANTIGAAAGALLCGFIIIPNWGLDVAIYCAVVGNILVALIALNLNKRIKLTAEISTQEDKLPTKIVFDKTLIILFSTGFITLSSEIVWTKYLSILTNTTIYGFTIILVLFLAGIALGSWAAYRLFPTAKHLNTNIIRLIYCLCFCLIYSRIALHFTPDVYLTLKPYMQGFYSGLLIKAFIVSLTLLPTTLLLGMIFTLSIRQYCENTQLLHTKVGIGFSINTIGGIFGALITGLWIIPEFGSNALIFGLIIFLAILPLMLSLQSDSSQFKAFIGVSFALIAINLFLPQLNFSRLIDTLPYYFDPDSKQDRKKSYIFLKEGKSSVISVAKYPNGGYRLQNNNLPEAVVSPPDPFPWLTETLLGMAPAILHPDAKNAFCIGLGASTTVSGLALSNLNNIDIVELEPQIIAANKVIYKKSLAIFDDPRIKLYIDDARHRLLLSDTQYDIIASQPSHPWINGNANMFTKEHFSIVKSHLKPQGIALQWINLFGMDTYTLKSILKSFYQVFPFGFTFNISQESSLIMIGSASPVLLNPDDINQRLADKNLNKVLRKWGINNFFDLMNYFGLSREDVIADTQEIISNSDLNILSETRLSKMTKPPQGDDNPFLYLKNNIGLNVINYLDNNINKKQALLHLKEHYQDLGNIRSAQLIQKQLDQLH